MVKRYDADKWTKSMSCWNQLLLMMFGQLSGCDSLRELIYIVAAHQNKSYHLGFGKGIIARSTVEYANAHRDYRLFEEFAYYMIALAQSKRIDREFVLNGKFYAFDSTTIDLCLSLYEWARFRKAKGGIKVHTLFDVVTQIPQYIHITEANVHDVNAMDDIPYEPNAFYIFDKGYYDYFELKARDVAMLYKQRWQVELFFRWIKQHLRVKSFWGNTENAVRIQIYVAIITYCLVAIVEHDCELGRSTFNVLRVLNHSLLDKTTLRDLFGNQEKLDDRYVDDCLQLKLNFEY